MPTYEYRCTDCGEDLEVVQSFQDDPLTECPRCHGKLRKVFGSIGISFKGSGFYRNDSRSSVRTSSSTASSSSGDGGDSSSSSSDSSGTKSSAEKSTSSSDTSSGNGSTSSGKAAASSTS